MSSGTNYGLVILASGQSHRFGDKDKLLAPFRGKALATHAATLALDPQLTTCICVLRPACPQLERIFLSANTEFVVNGKPQDGQGRSLSLGISAIAQHSCDGAFVILADMPFVKTSHLNLLRHGIGDHEAAIAFNGQRRSPPALFRRSMFQRLISQTGDSGAKDILRDSASVKNIAMPADDLIDIDSPEDLKRYDSIKSP